MTRPSDLSIADLIRLQHEALPRLDWPRQPPARLAHRPAQIAGQHRGTAAVRGLEFRETRQYLPGDDPRLIDWRQTARRGKPYVRVLDAERDHAVWLGVSMDASMRFGSQGALKAVLALQLAAWFAWSAVRGGDRVGLLASGLNASDGLLPRRGAAGALAVCDHLWRRSAADPVRPNAPLEHGEAPVRPGDSLIWIDDFYDERMDAALAPLTRRAHVGLVQVVDPLEADAPPPGRYPVRNAAGVVSHLDTRDPAVRAAWGAPLQARHRRLDAWCAAQGAARIICPTTSQSAQWRRAFLVPGSAS